MDARVAEVADMSQTEAKCIPSELQGDEQRGRRERALLHLAFCVPEDGSSEWDQSHLPNAVDTEFSHFIQHKQNKNPNKPCPKASTQAAFAYAGLGVLGQILIFITLAIDKTPLLPPCTCQHPTQLQQTAECMPGSTKLERAESANASL